MAVVGWCSEGPWWGDALKRKSGPDLVHYIIESLFLRLVPKICNKRYKTFQITDNLIQNDCV